MNTAKTLIILRHGQAQNSSADGSDHGRELTEQGKNESRKAGQALSDSGIVPDYVLCSTASRTRATLTEAQNYFSEPLNVEYSQKIYNSSERDLINEIAKTPETINSVLLIGHNPSLYQLAIMLAKDGEEQILHNLHFGFPTCAMAVIKFDGNWQEIKNSDSKLTLFAVPER